MSEQTFDPATPAPNKERPFLPRINDGGILGPLGEEVSVPMSFIQNREITLTGTFRYANTYEDAIALVVAGRIDLQSLITGYYPLHEAEKALQATRSDPANIKSVVVP